MTGREWKKVGKGCSCGRPISRYLKGRCMACRYRDHKQKKIRLKVDPKRLPVPQLAPTKPVRIDIEPKGNY